MMHEATERQKFVSDAQYLRDIQHKEESEYRACLRRQEYKTDSTEKKQDPLLEQDTSFERPQFSSRSSSRRSSCEEEPLAEPRLSAKSSSSIKSDAKPPAIDQTSVKQKHKSTMTPNIPEKAGPSKPSPAAQVPQILSRMRRPNLGKLTVGPETQSPRVSGDRSRQKSQLPAKTSAPKGADPEVLQKGPVWASDTKLKRPTRERRNLVPSSQLTRTAEKTSERASKRETGTLSQTEPYLTTSQAVQGTNSPQVLSGSLGPAVTSLPTGGSRRAPFRFRDEDFYSILALNAGEENDDTEEETHLEEEFLLVGMQPPRSPPNHKRSRFLGTLATQSQNETFEGNPEKCRANSLRRSELSHGSLRVSKAMQPVTGQPSAEQRMFRGLGLLDGESAKEMNRSDSEFEKRPFHSCDSQSRPRQAHGLNVENGPNDCTSVVDGPSTHYCERDWQDCSSSSRNSFDCFLSDRPTALRPAANSSYNTPGSLMRSALRDDISADLSRSSLSVHTSDSEGISRFNTRRPLSPIRSRNPLASGENHSDVPVDSAREPGLRGAEDIALTSQPRGAPLCPEALSQNPPGDLSSVDSSTSSPSEMNLQGQLHVPGPLQENSPFTFFAVSNFPNQNVNRNRRPASGFPNEKEAVRIKRDPETLKKLQESLLEEDYEEEGDLCRICQIAGGSPTNPLLEPCGCVGSLRFVHQECLKKWLQVKITSGASLGAVKTCEMCKQDLLVDLEDFNMNEFYRKHQQSRAQNELMNSGLYLVLLLHLYEQRFAELTRLNYSRVARERLSRNYPQPRLEENESPETGDGSESSLSQSNSRVP